VDKVEAMLPTSRVWSQFQKKKILCRKRQRGIPYIISKYSMLLLTIKPTHRHVVMNFPEWLNCALKESHTTWSW